MRICDLHTGTIRITKAGKDLRDQCSQAYDHWKDQNREDFDAMHIRPLGPQITMLIAAVHKLNDVFEKAEHDLRDKDKDQDN